MNASTPPRVLPDDPSSAQAQARVNYWRQTRRLTLWLLALWFGVTWVVSWFARDLDIVLAGWPLSFWAAAEGALVVYVLIVAAYGWSMDRLDAACREASRCRSVEAGGGSSRSP